MMKPANRLNKLQQKNESASSCRLTKHAYYVLVGIARLYDTTFNAYTLGRERALSVNHKWQKAHLLSIFNQHMQANKSACSSKII